MWVYRFRKYRTCFYKCVWSGSIQYVLQCKVRIPVFSYSLGSSAGNKTYHPMRSNLRFLNMTLSSGFVKISSSRSFVTIGKMEIVLSATCFQKWWYLMAICFVLGVNLNSLPLWYNCCYLRILCSAILVWYYEEEKIRRPQSSNSWKVLLLSLLEIELCSRILSCSMLFQFIAYYTTSGDIRHTLSQRPFSIRRTLGWYDLQMTSLLRSPRQRIIPILESYLV